MSVSGDQIFSQAPDCLLEEMDNEVLLYNPKSNLTLHLNQSSSLVWQLLDGVTSVSDLIQQLQHQFPESHEQIEQDVLDVLADMQENKVIVSKLSS